MRIGKTDIDLQQAVVMTIVNVTPDSFYAPSRTIAVDDVVRRAVEAVEAGASIIDVGGYSTRPDCREVSLEQELQRVVPATKAIRRALPDTVLSLDTFRAEVARQVMNEVGEVIINDISGCSDLSMVDVAARWRVPYILMHMRGTPQTMMDCTSYDDLVAEVEEFFARQIAMLEEGGVESVILDAGFGFSKTIEQNYLLLQQMHRLQRFGRPLLAGLSRKSMIYRPLGLEAKDVLPQTMALNWEALRQGARILRVHDTAETVATVDLFNKYMNGADLPY